MTRPPRISLAVLLVSLVAVGSGSVIADAASTTSAATKAPTLGLRNTSLGKVLVDSHNRTLYEFGHDLKNKSRCSGMCATNWPPAKSPAKPTLAKGLSPKKLKVIRRADGSRQLSYAGHPLYRFIGDTKPGNVNGEGINAFGGIWYVLSKSGALVTGPPATSGSTGSGTGTYTYPGY